MGYRLSQLDHTAIGAFCGVTEITLMQPTVAFKNALQEGRRIPINPIQWYRGYLMNVVSITPTISMQFSSNYIFDKLYRQFFQKTPDGGATVLIAACAGASSAVVVGPTEMVVIQQQRNYEKLQSLLPKLWRNYGITTITKGLDATMSREAIYCAGYLGVAPVLKEAMDSWTSLEGVPASTKVLFSGIVGGVIAALFSQPFDTIKTRMQAHLDTVKHPEYKTAWSSIQHVAKTHGVAYLWKGILPRGFRLVCASMIINVTRSFMIEWLEGEHSPLQRGEVLQREMIR
eukprot:TRINITY_DN24087_c0_g2_i3.p1 TRINITY_DN24087_c0_g2~~TRINITY_DN24087_c0_g2_i3.p1  ORF type:complete len:287 (-),score=21.82 TRINITY_DN24087_c0_g2_i3:245-1105(-)